MLFLLSLPSSHFEWDRDQVRALRDALRNNAPSLHPISWRWAANFDWLTNCYRFAKWANHNWYLDLDPLWNKHYPKSWDIFIPPSTSVPKKCGTIRLKSFRKSELSPAGNAVAKKPKTWNGPKLSRVTRDDLSKQKRVSAVISFFYL